MADTPNKIWTRCTACRSKYLVIFTAIGHHARCKKCGTSFRVEEHNPHPTEDDILRWLNEATEENDVPARPRVITGTQRRVGSLPVTGQAALAVENVGPGAH